MIARIAVFITMWPVWAPVAQQATYQTSDYLPMEVGNSWTYRHGYKDERFDENDHRVERPSFPAWEESSRELTISILRTEVIGGNTYYVFSDMPEDGWPPAPRMFIAGKKMRWNGNNLMEHDGTSEYSIYNFIPPPGEFQIHDYSIPETHGNGYNHARAMYAPSSHYSIPHVYFLFTGYRGYGEWPAGQGVTWDSSAGVEFWGGYGVIRAGEGVGADDVTVFDNAIGPVRATLHTSSSSEDARSDGDETTRTIEWENLYCIAYGYCSPTSTPSSSWGKVKSSHR